MSINFQSSVSRRHAMTLLEMMVVVLLIGMLAVLAIPNVLQSRETTRMNICLNNLRQLESAKEQLTIEKGLTIGAQLTLDDVADYLQRSHLPQCQAGGSYEVGDVGEPPICSYESERYPHVLTDPEE